MGNDQILITCSFKNEFAVRYLMDFNLNEDKNEPEDEQFERQFRRKFKERIGSDFDGKILFVETLDGKIVTI